MLHASILCGSFRIGKYAATARLNLRATLAGLGAETTNMVLRSRE
jgi:hypothetical protein